MRNYDCFSETYVFADELLRLHWLFRGLDNKDIFNAVWYTISVLLDIYGGARWVVVCSDESKFKTANPYRVGNLAGKVKTFTDPYEGWQLLFDLPNILGIIRDGVHAYFSFSFFGWQSVDFVHSAVTGLTRFLMMIDKWAGGPMVKPKKPWIRFYETNFPSVVSSDNANS